MQYCAARHFLPCNAAKKCQWLPSSLSSDYVVCGKETHFLINLTIKPFSFFFFSLIPKQIVCVHIQCLKITEVSSRLSYAKKHLAFYEKNN